MNINFLKSGDAISVPESSLSDKLPSRTCTFIVLLSRTDASAVDSDSVAMRAPALVRVTAPQRISVVTPHEVYQKRTFDTGEL